jgi:large subunit ribosomal protein L19
VNLLEDVNQRQRKAEENIPKFNVGDTVRVHFRIVEGEKERVQVYEGVVIGRNGNECPTATFTVRRVAFGVGVERVFPLHSPRVERVQVIREGDVRRAKLYYVRGLSGKAARVKAKQRSTKKAPAAAAAPAPEQASVE